MYNFEVVEIKINPQFSKQKYLNSCYKNTIIASQINMVFSRHTSYFQVTHTLVNQIQSIFVLHYAFKAEKSST